MLLLWFHPEAEAEVRTWAWMVYAWRKSHEAGAREDLSGDDAGETDTRV